MHDTMIRMTPLSRWALSKDEQGKIKDLFLSELVRITNKKEMDSLIKSMLSDSESLMLAKRLVGFVLIDEGRSDMEISRILHITRATAAKFRMVYRHAKDLDSPVVKTVNRLKTSEVMKLVLKEVLLKYALPAAFGRIPKKGIF